MLLEISRSVRRILHNDLYFHPYKMTVVQELSQSDKNNPVAACEKMLENLPQEAVFFSDEAHFYLFGGVNKQNFRYWCTDNPRELHERPLHSDKVTVWCAVSEMGIIGPYFFEEGTRAVTVNSERYIAMIQNFLVPSLAERNVQNAWVTAY